MTNFIRDFRLPPPCQSGLHSSWMLCVVDLWLVTDVSGQPVGLTFNGRVVQEESSWTA